VAGFTHAPPTFTSPAVQPTWHLPFEQTWPVPQALPQAPQWRLSDSSSTQVPPQTFASPLQSSLEHAEVRSAAPARSPRRTRRDEKTWFMESLCWLCVRCRTDGSRDKIVRGGGDRVTARRRCRDWSELRARSEPLMHAR
jgi:hypothetical protein